MGRVGFQKMDPCPSLYQGAGARGISPVLYPDLRLGVGMRGQGRGSCFQQPEVWAPLAGTTKLESSLGMGGSVVTDLPSELPVGVHYLAFFDKLLRSLKLTDRLSAVGLGATETIRANWLENCNLQDSKSLMKCKRGSHDYQQDVANKIIAAHCHDSSIVMVASNCHGVEPLQKARVVICSEQSN